MIFYLVSPVILDVSASQTVNWVVSGYFPGKLEGGPKPEQSRLQTPERKLADLKDKQASYQH